MVRVHEVSSSGLPCNGINCFVHLVPYYLWHLPPVRHHPNGASSCTRGFMYGSLTFSNFTSYVDHSYSTYDIFNNSHLSLCSATSTSVQRATALLLEQPPASASAKDRLLWLRGDVSSLAFNLQLLLLLLSHHLCRSHCACGMEEGSITVYLDISRYGRLILCNPGLPNL